MIVYKGNFVPDQIKYRGGCEFYDYFVHLEKFGFKWEILPMSFNTPLIFQPIKNIIKTMSIKKTARKKLFIDELEHDFAD